MTPSPDFIPTVAKIVATLIGFIGAIFVFWYNTQKTELKKKPELLKIHLILFTTIIIVGITILILTSALLYYTPNEIAISISYNLFTTLLLLGLTYFIVIVDSIWPKK